MVIALDVGTSSARAALYDKAGRAVPDCFHQVSYSPRVTSDGGAEHDAETLFDAVVHCVDAVVARAGAHDIAGIGIASFWHGLLGFDAEGRAATPIYLWADTRSTDDAEVLRSALDEEMLRRRTGCYLHASYWPAKLRWFLRARPAEAARIRRWGSFGEYLELRLFGEAGTSVSIASGTGLFDQERQAWDPEALNAAGLEPEQLFPLVDRTDGRRGLLPRWSRRWPALRGAAWFPAVGDGAASNIGSGCIGPRRIALNVGTSAALRVVTVAPPPVPRGLWRYRVDRTWSVFGGATSEGGNIWAWCRDVLQLPPADEVERALARDAGRDGLVALPFLAGERSPGWRGRRRGAISGLGLDTTALEVLRALLEAVALRLALVYDLVAPCAEDDHQVIASGGAIEQSPAWLAMIAAALGRPIVPAREHEATSRGVAVLTLHALGVLTDLSMVSVELDDPVEPDPARHARYREALIRQQALDRALE